MNIQTTLAASSIYIMYMLSLKIRSSDCIPNDIIEFCFKQPHIQTATWAKASYNAWAVSLAFQPLVLRLWRAWEHGTSRFLPGDLHAPCTYFWSRTASMLYRFSLCEHIFAVWYFPVTHCFDCPLPLMTCGNGMETRIVQNFCFPFPETSAGIEAWKKKKLSNQQPNVAYV